MFLLLSLKPSVTAELSEGQDATKCPWYQQQDRSTSQKVIYPRHGDMEPLCLCQDAAQELSLCPGLLYLHQNLGISDLPQPADASGLPEAQELQMVAHWKNSWLQTQSCPLIFKNCTSNFSLTGMADKIRHQLIGKIIAEQNDPLFSNSPSKNGFVLLWGFFVYFFFSQTATFKPNHKSMTISLAQQQTRTWDRSHELWAASQNTTEISLQGLLSKLVCGLDTSVKTFFFYKTKSSTQLIRTLF